MKTQLDKGLEGSCEQWLGMFSATQEGRARVERLRELAGAFHAEVQTN
jgi:hypothetical protein